MMRKCLTNLKYSAYLSSNMAGIYPNGLELILLGPITYAILHWATLNYTDYPAWHVRFKSVETLWAPLQISQQIILVFPTRIQTYNPWVIKQQHFFHHRAILSWVEDEGDPDPLHLISLHYLTAQSLWQVREEAPPGPKLILPGEGQHSLHD